MIRIGISVEGYTEDEFCKQVLRPYFSSYGILIQPIIVTTKRNQCGKKFKGGCVNLDRIKSELSKILPNFDYVTTFYDLYGFDIDEAITADALEEKIRSLFPDNHKLIPYIQKYEFETLLFSEPAYYETYFDNSNARIEMEHIITSCGSVEAINNSVETAPSKRICKFFDQYAEQYDKVFHGPSIIHDIGLERIMSECPRFKNWIDRLKDLS